MNDVFRRRTFFCIWRITNLFCNKSSPFYPFLHILAYTGYANGTIAVNVTWMERGFNAGQTHTPFYLQPFTSYSEILVGNCNFFLPALHLTPPLGVIPLDDLRDFWWVSCWMARLQCGAKISPKS